MKRIIVLLIFVLGLTTIYGCETMNKGAEKVGEGTGKVLNVPNSASEGAAGALQGKPESNPYNR